MSKKIKIIISILAFVVVGGSISLAALSVYKPEALRSALNNTFNKPYYAVYLTTGEIYIGKLSTFPKLTLTDVYLLQIVPDQTDATKKAFQLAPLKDALWSPDKIFLNKDQIVFTAPVREDSEVAKAVRSKE